MAAGCAGPVHPRSWVSDRPRCPNARPYQGAARERATGRISRGDESYAEISSGLSVIRAVSCRCGSARHSSRHSHRHRTAWRGPPVPLLSCAPSQRATARRTAYEASKAARLRDACGMAVGGRPARAALGAPPGVHRGRRDRVGAPRTGMATGTCSESSRRDSVIV